MQDVAQYQNQIAQLLKQAIIDELSKSYPSQGYNGEYKRGKGPKKATGELINSVEVTWETDIEQGQPLLVVTMEDYYYWIDQGRKPSLKYPPLDSIQKWVRAKPIIFRDVRGRFSQGSLKTRTFLIARSIKEKGFKGINFLTNAENAVINQLVEQGELLCAAYFEGLIEEGLVTARR